MTVLYCSQRHENPPNSRFCHQCGERLSINEISQGLLLGERYRIARELGHGGFGRTYLAEDTNRFNEPCVLKEFAPQIQGTYALQKGMELFEREAGVLYQLQHPQIPRFRELFRAKLGEESHLFLVQDYVEGQTYRDLLEERKRQGQTFSEAEATQLLLQLLPVLDYIHSLGVVHRDISPDNLMLRQVDGLPVLIDFGGVKQVAATVASQFMAYPGAGGVSPPATRLGKVGYAPDEQMRMGVVFPHSDLYALAVTVLVLLTGKEPQELIDGYTLNWTWQRDATLSPALATVLNKMLAHQPGDRYQSARAVIEALNATVAAYFTPTQPPSPPALATVPISVPVSPAATQATVATAPILQTNGTVPAYPAPTPPPAIARPQAKGWGQAILILLLFVGVGTGSWWVGSQLLQSRLSPFPRPTVSVDPEPSPDPQFSAEERTRKEAIRDRRTGLGIDYNFFITLVNQEFYEQYPELQGQVLGSGPEDADSRAAWDQVAIELLDKLEPLSAEARSRMGRYTAADRDRWKTAVNKRFLSSRALYNLADARFFQLFPNQRNQDFLQQPIGQVWHAVVADQLTAIQDGSALETIRFNPQAFSAQVSGTLEPAQGKAYIANLQEGQIMRLNLQADQSTQLSIYPPTRKTPTLLENSADTTWSGRLPESGYYEFVIISDASEPLSYQLDLAADNVTSTPAPPEPPPPPETKE